MEVKTGRILGMGSYPNFDLNDPRDLTFTGMYTREQVDAMKEEDKTKALSSIWRNFCISDTYEPGSTYKPFTVASGLESGKLAGNESFYCGGYEIIDGVQVKCSHTAGHGPLDVEMAVAESCNAALMQMSYKIGIPTFTRYQSIFGFGKKTGIDLPGEVNAAKLLYTADTMTDLDLAVNSFGQNFNVTMVQMAAGICSIINDGKYYQPHLVDRIVNSDGETVETFEPKLLKQTISPETSANLRKYLRAVVEKGTAISAKVEGYDVGGKTGTAEKFPRNKINYLVSFLGFAPVDEPELLVYVVIDEPNVENQANSKLALDLCQAIMSRVFPYYGVTKLDGTSTRDVTMVDVNDVSWVYESENNTEGTEIWEPGTSFSDGADVHFDTEDDSSDDYPDWGGVDMGGDGYYGSDSGDTGEWTGDEDTGGDTGEWTGDEDTGGDTGEWTGDEDTGGDTGEWTGDEDTGGDTGEWTGDEDTDEDTGGSGEDAGYTED